MKQKKETNNVPKKIYKKDQSLQKENDQLKKALEASMAGIFVLDQDKKLTFVNERAARMLGHEKGQSLVGKRFLDLVERDKKEEVQNLFELLENKKEVSNELKLKSKQGHPVFMMAQWSCQKNKDKSCSFTAETLDISHQKKVVNELELISERFRLAKQSAHIGIWDWDMKTNNLSWDEQMFRLYGINENKPKDIYSFWQQTVHSDDQEKRDQEIKEALKGEKDLDSHYRVIWPDETVHHLRAFAIVKRDEKNKPIRMIGANWDITKEMQLDQSKSEFVSLTSHQLKTPLTSTKWYIEMFLNQDMGNLTEQQQQVMEALKKSNDQLGNLVQGLLNASRLDLGTYWVKSKKISLVRLCQSVLKKLKSDFESRKQSVKENYEPTSIDLKVDENIMEIIFRNLLSNAHKFTPDNGKIEISIKKNDKEVIITVKDNGMGIPAEEQTRIFSKLFQASNARLNNIDGAGLGLYTIKTVLEATGGDISFQSKEGKGSTFIVTLPLTGMKAKKGTRALE